MNATCHPSTCCHRAALGLAILAALALASAPPTATAQGTARAWAMGGAATAVASGLDAVEFNPANLAFSPGVSLGLFNVGVDVHNNAFSLSRYNEISGAQLDEADKQRILADIPDGGFSLDADVRASVLGLQFGHAALTVQGFAAGHGNLDRDVFDLVLFGNEIGQTVDFQDTWGEAYAVGAATLSYGMQVLSSPLGRLAVGANARYLRGLYEMHVEDAHGSLATTFDAITGEAAVTAVTAEGGSGYAFDLGATLQARGGWTLSLALDNVASGLDWTDHTERRLYSVTASDVYASQDNLDAAIVDADTTITIGSYRTTLPRRVRLGASHETAHWLVAADWIQGLETRGNATTHPQLCAGAQWRLCGWFAPRAGMTFGGVTGTGITGGAGLQFGWWHLDVAVMNRGGFAPDDTRGLGLGLSSQLVF